MDGPPVVVKRYYVDGGDGDKCYLSLLSPRDFSPIENLNLPLYTEDDDVKCNSCGPLLILDDFEGNIVLCNLTTKQLKFLPPPELETPLSKDNYFDGSGLGYDSKSDDYKVIRNHCCKTEVYSLKTGVWKTIPSPDAAFYTKTGVYVNGSCYWLASLGSSFGGQSAEFEYDILSFDFTTESFNAFLKPPVPDEEDSESTLFLVEYNGLLGAIGYDIESSEISKPFELWVREESRWSKVFDVVLSGAERPLGLKDGRWLFLEGRRCNQLCQLMVYDLKLNDLKELGIYDYLYILKVTFYVESQFALPDARPMQRSYTDEEEVYMKRKTRFVVLSESESETETESESKSEDKSESEDDDDDMEEDG